MPLIFEYIKFLIKFLNKEKSVNRTCDELYNFSCPTPEKTELPFSHRKNICVCITAAEYLYRKMTTEVLFQFTHATGINLHREKSE